jgi:divinyl chlorophyllide a 8-vinyl-reductase
MRVLMLGATGTIGLATVKALLDEGHEVVCLVRNNAGVKGAWSTDQSRDKLAGAEVRVCDVQSMDESKNLGLQGETFDVIVSCLASRTGAPRDAWAIDYRTHSQWLNLAKTSGISQFVLLSAICVQKPLLGFSKPNLLLKKNSSNPG